MPPSNGLADLVRIVRGVRGTVDFSMALCICADYGRTVPRVRHIEDGIAAVTGPDAVYVRADVELTGRDKATTADFTVEAGADVSFVLTWNESHREEPPRTDPLEAVDRTPKFWSDWLSVCKYTGRWAEEVHRSLITLKALTYRPTGGTVAAATTSLPEQPGARGTVTTAIAGCGTPRSPWRRWCPAATPKRPRPGAIGCFARGR